VRDLCHLQFAAPANVSVDTFFSGTGYHLIDGVIHQELKPPGESATMSCSVLLSAACDAVGQPTAVAT